MAHGENILLDVQQVGVRFGGIVALDRLSFQVERGQICGLIGPNGAGKTTLFNVVGRIYEPSSGAILFEGRDLLSVPAHGIVAAGIARTFQNLALFPTMTVLENVMVGGHARSRANFLSAPLRIGTHREEKRLQQDALRALALLDLADLALRPCTGFAYGTLKRIEIARALVAEPRLLLLDEPASGLTHSEVRDLGNLITTLRRQLDLTVLLVEHHMAMVMGISDNVVVLHLGTKLAEGPPAMVQQDERVLEAYLGAPA